MRITLTALIRSSNKEKFNYAFFTRLIFLENRQSKKLCPPQMISTFSLISNLKPTMPVSLGGSYHSLTGSEDVYRSTTVTGGNGNVLDSVKKALNLVSSSQTKDERLITAKQPIIISSRYSRANQVCVLICFNFYFNIM